MLRFIRFIEHTPLCRRASLRFYTGQLQVAIESVKNYKKAIISSRYLLQEDMSFGQ
jgi:hypothetical protein